MSTPSEPEKELEGPQDHYLELPQNISAKDFLEKILSALEQTESVAGTIEVKASSKIYTLYIGIMAIDGEPSTMFTPSGKDSDNK